MDYNYKHAQPRARGPFAVIISSMGKVYSDHYEHAL